MVSVCFYFQVHQPFRMKEYRVFDIGKHSSYFEEQKNRAILRKVADKCYLPTNKLLLGLLKKHPGFKISYSFSGVVLEQFEQYFPEVLHSFQKLVQTGQVEILDETYYHSLAFLHSLDEFKEQVLMHRKRVQELFGATPQVFRNTELIYSNELARVVAQMGYKGILAEGADHVLGWRSPNFLYRPKDQQTLKVLLKNYRLSDDIAFRFSNKAWEGFPLTSEKYARWVDGVNGNGHCVNLFMDYETFGEHQWEDTGIFAFLEHLPAEILKNPDNNFKTPSELVDGVEPVGELDVPFLVSWADMERDISAWQGNSMQQSALSALYQLEQDVKAKNDPVLLADWRRLQTSDNFYYMCTKWFSDGDVHKYFNPYESPYDSYIAFMNILNDLKMRVEIEKIDVHSPKVQALTNL
ncbi:alpha-amylase [Candidatus Woesearchaeota archaeon]|nr:alpha-amylase [Candidatus Woesearchaeota archaeon]